MSRQTSRRPYQVLKTLLITAYGVYKHPVFRLSSIVEFSQASVDIAIPL